jgi:hypothetical protein
MSVTINAKGTSTTSFKVGKAGTIITQGGVISPPAATNLKIDLDVGQYLDVNAGITGPSLITTSDNKDLHINPAVGGGQNLVLVANRWPTQDGTVNQFLVTDGNGTLSFVTPVAAWDSLSASQGPSFSIPPGYIPEVMAQPSYVPAPYPGYVSTVGDVTIWGYFNNQWVSMAGGSTPLTGINNI